MHVRLAILLAVVAAVCWAPAAHARAPASVRMLSCTPWQEDAGGSVSYLARMHAVPGTKRMSLRFRLYEKLGDGEFERVSTEELGIWRRSHPGASAFRYEQRVKGLHQGAVYRAAVRYRWHGADGVPILTARRLSPECSQPGGLPNLFVASVKSRPGEVDGTAVYEVKIVNRGASAAEHVGVLLRVDGEVVDDVEVIDALEPGGTRTVTFNGPVCERRVRVVVDPKELIAESDEQDNVRDPACL